MKITNSGYNYTHKGGLIIKRAHGSGDYVFVLFKSPSVVLLDNRLIHIPASTALIYKKGTPQWYGNPNQDFINDFFHFELDDSDINMLEQLRLSFDTLDYLNGTSLFSRFIKDIGYELHANSPHKDETCVLYAKLLFIKLAENIYQNAPAKLNPYYRAFYKLRSKIYNSPASDWKIDNIASDLSLSRSRFQHLYKTFFGVSTISDIINSRIERAQYMLYSSSKSIGDISLEAGYKNVTSFIRQFKDITGMSPSEYRNHVGGSEQNYIHSKERLCTLDFKPEIRTEEVFH